MSIIDTFKKNLNSLITLLKSYFNNTDNSKSNRNSDNYNIEEKNQDNKEKDAALNDIKNHSMFRDFEENFKNMTSALELDNNANKYSDISLNKNVMQDQIQDLDQPIIQSRQSVSDRTDIDSESELYEGRVDNREKSDKNNVNRRHYGKKYRAPNPPSTDEITKNNSSENILQGATNPFVEDIKGNPFETQIESGSENIKISDTNPFKKDVELAKLNDNNPFEVKTTSAINKENKGEQAVHVNTAKPELPKKDNIFTYKDQNNQNRAFVLKDSNPFIEDLRPNLRESSKAESQKLDNDILQTQKTFNTKDENNLVAPEHNNTKVSIDNLLKENGINSHKLKDIFSLADDNKPVSKEKYNDKCSTLSTSKLNDDNVSNRVKRNNSRSI